MNVGVGVRVPIGVNVALGRFVAVCAGRGVVDGNGDAMMVAVGVGRGGKI